MFITHKLRELPYDPEIPFLEIYSKKIKTYALTNMYALILQQNYSEQQKYPHANKDILFSHKHEDQASRSVVQRLPTQGPEFDPQHCINWV